MSNVYELPERRDPVEEAGVWLAQLDRGLNKGEEAALSAWLAADPSNRAALMESAQVWDKMDSLSGLADLFPHPAQRQSKPARSALALAATVLIAVLAGYWSLAAYRAADPNPASALAGAETEQVFQTAVGEQSIVTLPDGSRVTLNTNSLIRARFTEQRRLLSLERGEVYFQVAHDPSRPFVVWVGNRFVEAIGTAFNVVITEDQRIELIVTEGTVQVGVADKKTIETNKKTAKEKAAASETPARLPVPIVAGERILLDGDNGKVEPIAPEELEVRLSWRGGNLVFRGESLDEALAEIERYTRVEFVIQDENLKNVHIVGMFKAGDVDGLLATLRQNFDISYQRVSDEKVILTNMSTP